MCVYSDEVLPNLGENESCGTEKCMCPKNPHHHAPGDPELADHEWCSKKARINGTSSHMPAMFGLTIAGMVTKAIFEEQQKNLKQPV